YAEGETRPAANGGVQSRMDDRAAERAEVRVLGALREGDVVRGAGEDGESAVETEAEDGAGLRHEGGGSAEVLGSMDGVEEAVDIDVEGVGQRDVTAESEGERDFHLPIERADPGAVEVVEVTPSVLEGGGEEPCLGAPDIEVEAAAPDEVEDAER